MDYLNDEYQFLKNESQFLNHRYLEKIHDFIVQKPVDLAENSNFFRCFAISKLPPGTYVPNIGIVGNVLKECSITIDAVDNSKSTCTCQFPKQNLPPCSHILFVCKHKGLPIYLYFNNVWR